MLQHFQKYHGAGNDFILIDDRNRTFKSSQDLVARLCDRHLGIGADGLILLTGSSAYDFSMVYFNSDGRESTMCGNGGRCLVAYADYLSLVHGTARFDAIDGPHEGSVISKSGNDYLVRIKLNDVNSVKEWGDDLIINTGSPHLLLFGDDISDLDIIKTARPLRYHKDFEPDGINVNFIKDAGEFLYVRTYERGVEDETLSCGTGVTASVVAYATRQGLDEGRIRVHTRGGDLWVTFKKNTAGKFTDIWLEGPVKRVFDGVIDTDFI